MNINPQVPLFHIVGIFFFFPFGLDLSCVSLVEKTRREREQRGIGVGREREGRMEKREREGDVWLLRNSLSFLISLKE